MYQDQIIVDGLQYCHWDRDYFISLRDSGITAVHVTLVYHENARETLSQFSRWNRHFESNKDLIMSILEVEDIYQAKASGRVGIFLGAQNCSPIDDEIGLIEVMRRQGLLIMQLTYNNQSLLASGCYEKMDSGVTRFGRQAIAEMNRVGMIIDMSHSGEESTLQAIDLSSRPICISHANPDFAHSALRNKSTLILKAIAGRGGLLGFSLYPFHLPGGSQCSLSTFCQMVADTAELIGVEHLSIGSDLCLNQPKQVLEWMRNGRWSKKMDYGEGSASNTDWPDALPWFHGTQGMENIYNGLVEQGFSLGETQKILGNNWLNLLREGLVPEGD